MSLLSTKFKVYKKQLKNGLTILVKEVNHIPFVETHLWYNVGSKDETYNERGAAHFIEHMLFKGTKKLSESDINTLCQKLTGDANAFTSQDCTCYTFRFPAHVWETSLEILAECMQNALFDPVMVASEREAIVEELRLYQENYQGFLIEKVIDAAYRNHPYHSPIIGTKHDLYGLTPEKLIAFYKKHYHPANATLVVAGNTNHATVFANAEKYFGAIESPCSYTKEPYPLYSDLIATTTTIVRTVNTPWYCYAYKVPGLGKGNNHLPDLASFILSSGKSSRLYQRLINQEKIAISVDSSVYDLFDQGLFIIGVWPAPNVSPATIEQCINEELTILKQKPIHDWEFVAAQKRTQMDFITLLESPDKQAFVIGNSYMATKDESFIEKYLHAIATTNSAQLQQFFNEHFSPSVQHNGVLLPATEQQTKNLAQIHTQAEAIHLALYGKIEQKHELQKPRWTSNIKPSMPPSFTYPKPRTFTLPNNIDVIYLDNELIPQIIGIVNFKVNHLYESEQQTGILNFLLRVITDQIKGHDAMDFAKLLETHGITLISGNDTISFRCLPEDLEKVLEIITTILQHPVFDKQSIEKVRHQMLTELNEYWDSPIDFIDQTAREYIYKDHPYSKISLGTHKTITSFSASDLKKFFTDYISPNQAICVLVGDLNAINLEALLKKHFGNWQGKPIPDISYPPLQPHKAQILAIPMDRDQVVLGFVAPSIARKDKDFNALALLDIIVTGGAQSYPASRLYQLRETSGLFYTIGGSLVYGAHEQPGLVYIKTIVAKDKVDVATKLILDTIEQIGKKGITQQEFDMAKNILFASSIELFETNAQTAQTFLFLKKLGLSFNLFDKQGKILSILELDLINEIAQRFCNKSGLSTIQIGRLKTGQSVAYQKGETFTKEANIMAKKKTAKKKAAKKTAKKKTAKKAKKGAKKAKKKATTRRMKMRIVAK